MSSNLEKKLNLYATTSKTIDRIFADMDDLVSKLFVARQFDNKFKNKDVKSKGNESSIIGGYHPHSEFNKKDWCTCDKRKKERGRNPYFEPKNPNKSELVSLRSNAQQVTTKLLDILVSKHNDYGPNNIAKAPGGALNGLSVRLHDKVERLSNLIAKDKHPSHESIEDTFIDIANYAIIALLVLDNKWK